MIVSMQPNGVITHEICPECQEPDVKVEHGSDDNGKPMHYWHCPECGDSISIVCYDCPDCRAWVRSRFEKNLQ